MIVVSRDSLNRGSQVVMVLCTSARFSARSQLPNCVPFRAGEFGFTKDCVAQCEQILTLDKNEVSLSGPIGQLDELAMRSLIKALGFVFEADCKPD